MRTRLLCLVSLVAALSLATPLRADTYQYTVTWNGVVNIMPTASFQFTVSTLAASNGTIPLGQVTVLSNPCNGSVGDANPAIYGNSAFSINVNCLAPGWSNLFLDSLTATTATITAPGTYSFLTSSVTTSADYGSGRVPYADFQGRGGTVEVTRVSGVPEPATLALLGAGLVAIGWRRRRLSINASR